MTIAVSKSRFMYERSATGCGWWFTMLQVCDRMVDNGASFKQLLELIDSDSMAADRYSAERAGRRRKLVVCRDGDARTGRYARRGEQRYRTVGLRSLNPICHSAQSRTFIGGALSLRSANSSAN